VNVDQSEAPQSTAHNLVVRLPSCSVSVPLSPPICITGEHPSGLRPDLSAGRHTILRDAGRSRHTSHRRRKQ
jgi:hypothetical protein